jgi:hypothetical protein
MSDLQELRRELDTLRAEVAGLRAVVESRQVATEPTMRRRLRCPACSCTRIAHAPSVLDRSHGGNAKPLSLYLMENRWWTVDTKGAGELEAFVCTECGLVEWYVKDPGALVESEPHLRIIDGTSESGGPYR